MRYLPLTDEDRKIMLEKIGVASADDLFSDVPEGMHLDTPPDLPLKASEMAVEQQLSAMAAKNIDASQVPFFVGCGGYRHHVPATVDHLIQRSEFLTAYTPYQPEISQGTLQVLFEFQTQVAMLTGMDVANASMYDGSTGCAEAVLMAQRVKRRKRSVLSGGLHPQYREVVENQSRFGGAELVSMPAAPLGEEDILAQVDDKTACVVVQYPDFYGHIRDYTQLAKDVQAKGALMVIVVTEIMALGALKSPGDMGADIVVGEGQSIGNGLNFGGPYVGLFATRQKFVRQMPGRLCGLSEDADGERGFVLTLSTREQHIRREKATSNICTNSGLCALAFSIHLSLLGEKGLQELAQLNHAMTSNLVVELAKIDGVEVLNKTFFNEFTLRVNGKAADVIDRMVDKGVIAGVPVSRLLPNQSDLEDLMVVAVTETNSAADCAALVKVLQESVSG